MDILRISVLGVGGVLIGLLLKERAPEYVSLITMGQFTSGNCKDAGYASTGAEIELFCRLSVMVLSMPVLLALLDTIQGFLT